MQILANHAHVFPDSIWEKGSVKNLLRVLDECQIEKCVVFAPFKEFLENWDYNPNQWLAKKIKSYPRLIGYGSINPLSLHALHELQRVKDLGFKGVKLHPAVQNFNVLCKKAMKFYQKAEELKIILDFHTGIHRHRIKDDHPLMFDEIAHKFPNLVFVMEHIGGYSFFKDAVAVIQNNVGEIRKSNIYAGIASVFDIDNNPSWYLGKQKIEELIHLIGDNNLIFGLDFPYNDSERIQKDIEIIKTLHVSLETKEKILGKNLRNLLTMNVNPKGTHP